MDALGGKDNDIKASAPESVTDDNIDDILGQVEKCAETGENFYYGNDISAESLSEVREYAEVVGLPKDKIQSVDIGRAKAMVEANVKEPVVEPEAPIVDFDLTPKIGTDPKNFEKQQVTAEAQAASLLDYRPDMDSGVRGIRGGEDYNQAPEVGVRRGENSIVNPDAIADVAAAEEKSSRQLIREENQRREDIKFDRENWESEVSRSMDSSITPQAGLHRTESPEPQRHTRSADWNNSIMPSEDSNPMPDKTLGESISEINTKKASEIQRDRQEDEWEVLETSTDVKVSDLLYESLKKNLGK